MVPDDFRDFFLASTGAAAALIGLLFVAISVAPQRLIQEASRAEAQLLAGTALRAFSNVLVVSMIALIPDANIGWATAALGLVGLAFTAAGARTITDAARHGHAHRSSDVLVVLLLAVFGCELVVGIMLIWSAHNRVALTTVAVLLAASLTIGVARAWQLVGLRDTGLLSSIATLIRRDSQGHDRPTTPP